MEPSVEPRRLTSVEDTLSWVDESVDDSGAFSREAVIYRGQSTGWPLLPSLLRLEEIADHYNGFKEIERAVFEIFKSFSHPYLDSNKPDSEPEWMALAQHHGCPTRLIDWTKNPLVALFFATERDVADRYEDVEAVVWCYRDFKWYDEDWSKGLGSNAIQYLSLPSRTKAYSPKHISPRIAAQAGCFTLHDPGQLRWEFPSEKLPKPYLLGVRHMEEEFAIFNEEYCNSILASLPPEYDINGRTSFFDSLSVPRKLTLIPKTGSLRKAVIPPERKQSIRRQLDKLNINRASLFPGLDGISDYIKQTLNRSIGKD